MLKVALYLMFSDRQTSYPSLSFTMIYSHLNTINCRKLVSVIICRPPRHKHPVSYLVYDPLGMSQQAVFRVAGCHALRRHCGRDFVQEVFIRHVLIASQELDDDLAEVDLLVHNIHERGIEVTGRHQDVVRKS